jgi:hypothetical protein
MGMKERGVMVWAGKDWDTGHTLTGLCAGHIAVSQSPRCYSYTLESQRIGVLHAIVFMVVHRTSVIYFCYACYGMMG